MKQQVPIAVVGLGYFGRFHVQHLARHPNARLVAVVDRKKDLARSVAREFGCTAFTDYRDVIGSVAAASVVAPTQHHFSMARDLIEAGIDVLVEKPMTHDEPTAVALAATAQRTGRILQVGHIERFSSCFKEMSRLVERPHYIESNRIAPWRERGTDVDVVLDVMIHDLDIILGLARSPVASVEAVGTPVFSGKTDIANARIAFKSGCVANVTASRVSHKTQRTFRVFQSNAYFVCDFVESRIYSHALTGDPALLGPAAVSVDVADVPREDGLANEIDEFLRCVIEHRRPTVDQQAGLEAMRLAEQIGRSITRCRSLLVAP